MAIITGSEDSNRYKIINAEKFFSCPNCDDGQVSTEMWFGCEIHDCCKGLHRYKLWKDKDGIIVEELNDHV